MLLFRLNSITSRPLSTFRYHEKNVAELRNIVAPAEFGVKLILRKKEQEPEQKSYEPELRHNPSSESYIIAKKQVSDTESS